MSYRVYCWRVGTTFGANEDGTCPECSLSDHRVIDGDMCWTFTKCPDGDHGHPCELTVGHGGKCVTLGCRKSALTSACGQEHDPRNARIAELEEQFAAVTQERDECKAAMIRDRLEYVSTYEKALPVFEHVDPKLQECPDCHAEVGAPCAFHGDYTGPRGPSYVHINRCFTPGSRASIEAHYRGKKA